MLMSKNLEALIHDHLVVHSVIFCVFQLLECTLNMDKQLLLMQLLISV